MNNKNALILGVSSGFGKATAYELARRGYNIYGVHLDLGSMRQKAEELSNELAELGVKVRFFNLNAADIENMKLVASEINQDFKGTDNRIGILLHSIAFGSLGPLIDPDPEKEINRKKLEMSMNVMANSLLYWVQEVFHSNLFGENSRIFAMTSNGSNQATNSYGAVSMAKAAIEALVRQLAFELAPYKITANSILAGATVTPASGKIPDFKKMLKIAREHNPYQRNTVPEDAAKMMALLADEASSWLTGQVIRVDGGQSIFSYLPDYYGND